MKEKKKILFLIHALGVGGAEKILVNIANGMDKNKFDVTVMTVIDTGAFRENLNDDIKYKYIFKFPFNKNKKGKINPGNPLSKKGLIINLFAKAYTIMWKIIPMKLFYKIAIRERFDVEISFLEGICAKIISNSNNSESKKIAWIHVDMVNHMKSKAVFKSNMDESNCYDRFDKIVCVSENVKEKFIERFDISEKKISVCYNPIDRDEILKKSIQFVDDVERPNKLLLCTIGRLVTQKGYDRLLRVHKRLIEDGYDYELWIIGEGNKRNELEKYINDNKLENTVKLLGFKENPYKYLNLSDVFVCSSRAEGFSTVASEAVVLGKPIVTVECSGMKELLGENNEYGLVVNNNEEDLLDGIKIIFNSNIQEYYKEKSYERGKIFEYNTAIKNIEKLC